MIQKVPVDRDAVLRLSDFQPLRLFRGKAVALLQDQEIRRDFRAGVFQERVVREPHGSQQLGPLRKVAPHRGIPLVHRPLAGEKGNQAARSHFIQRLGKEIVMDEEFILIVSFVRKLIFSERDVADGEVEKVVGELRLFKAGNGDIRARVEPLRDPSRNAVELHAVQPAFCHTLRHESEKVAGSAGRLQNIASAEAEPFQHPVDRPDNQRGSVVGV